MEPLLPPGCYPRMTVAMARDLMEPYRGCDGSYLLRGSESSPGHYTICVFFQQRICKFRVTKDGNGMYVVCNGTYSSLEAILENFHDNPICEFEDRFVYLLEAIRLQGESAQYQNSVAESDPAQSQGTQHAQRSIDAGEEGLAASATEDYLLETAEPFPHMSPLTPSHKVDVLPSQSTIAPPLPPRIPRMLWPVSSPAEEIPPPIPPRNLKYRNDLPPTSSSTLIHAAGNASQENEDCRICKAAMSNCVLLKCRHMCCCMACGKNLRKCPVCRAHIQELLKVYRS